MQTPSWGAKLERQEMSEDLDAIRVITEPELRRILSISDQTFERLKARGDVPPKTQLSDRRIG